MVVLLAVKDVGKIWDFGFYFKREGRKVSGRCNMGKRRSRRGYWIAIWVLAFLLVGSWLTNMGLMAVLMGGGSQVVEEYPVDEEPYFDEVWSSGYGDAKVVRLALNGVIMRGEQERLFGVSPDPVALLLRQIRCATEDDEVAAILLEVDSPGGGVTASDEIYEALRRFRASEVGRRVVVHVRDVGASGAYYVAMAADYVMAEPTSIVGSVGVIMQTLNMKGLGDKLGLEAVTIASGENKDLLNPFEEVDTNQVALLQGVVDAMQDRFAGLVMAARDLESRALLDGRIFVAGDALEAGLIDGIGYEDAALDELARQLDVEALYVVRYEEQLDVWESLLRARGPSVSVAPWRAGPRFLYIWRP